MNGRPNEIKLAVNHLGIDNSSGALNSYFSFSADSFFNPEIMLMKKFATDNSLDEGSDIKYILSRYQNISSEKGLIQSEAVFNLEGKNYFNNNELAFSIYAPKLEESQGNVKIVSLEILLKK